MTELELLNDTIAYYSVDPVNRRCYNSINGACAYSPKTINKVGLSNGCAIGRHLRPEVQKRFDTTSQLSTIGRIISDDENKKLLPEWMQKMNVDFLTDIQNLHDLDIYWDENGLTESGKFAVKYIKNTYIL